MRRRAFLAMLSSAGLAARTNSTAAQKIGEMPRIVVVGIEPDQKVVDVFGKGMLAAGWVKDANCQIEYRWGSNDPQVIAAVASEVVKSNPSLIVTIASPNTLAARKLTSVIPTVFAVVSYPIGQGIVTNLAHPAGNVTGYSHFDTGMGGKWLQLIHEMIPQTTRFASVFNPTGGPYAELFQGSFEDAARSLGVDITPEPVHSDSEIQAVFERVAGAPNIGLLFPSDAFTYFRSRMIAALAAKHRIPAIYPDRRFVDDGGLVAYGPDLYEEIRSSANYVDRILKGAKPGDLPIQQPTKYTLVINLRAAKGLELNIPPSLLARADEVIE